MRRRTMTGRAGRAGAALALLVGFASCGGSGDGGGTLGQGDTTTTTAAATTTSSSTLPVERLAAPRWETVATLTGTGATTSDPLKILPDAIQWRARWKCDTGTLLLESDPPHPRRPKPVVDNASCPGKGDGYSTVTGDVKLKVAATGPWEIIVDQQIDIPLREPPLEGMAPASLLSQGPFYNIEMSGKGTAQLYRLPGGAHGLRLEGFEVSNNTDLFVWLSEAVNPKTSVDAVSSPYRSIGNLKSTVGDENYVLPADLPPEKVRSIIIWCQPVQVAYIAAALAPA